jgi:hypothetical protein
MKSKSDSLINTIKKYNTQVSLIDFYITKNINTLITKTQDLKLIQENNYLLGITNKVGKNSLNILLENSNKENSNVKILIDLINQDVRILRFKNRSGKTFLMSIIAYEEFYTVINKVLSKTTNSIVDNYYQFKIKLISDSDINNYTVIDLCIELLNLNYSMEKDKLIPIFTILKNIYELGKENIFLLIGKLCRDIKNENLLLSILKFIKIENLDIYPDPYNNTCIDYLIMEEKFLVLEYLLDKVEHIYFINFEENSIFTLLENLNNMTITVPIIELIFKILKKSNFNKLRDYKNENILFKLLKLFNLEIPVIKKFIDYFDMFEQNIYGENLSQLIVKKYPKQYTEIINKKYIVDSQIEISIPNIKIVQLDYKFNIKKYLKKTHYGIFVSDSLHNMIYTYIILKRNNLLIPFEHESVSQYTNLDNCIKITNNDKDIMSTIQFYFYNFNSWLPHLIVWKNSNNYFIYPQLVELIKQFASVKRFIYIKLSIIASTKELGTIRHANLILIDNLKKTVERFEPYGEIYFSNCTELNSVLKTEISDKLNYVFDFVQPYPGFQVRSNEYDQKNKSYGDPGGFCLAWCFLYLEMKIYYEEQITNQSSEFESMQVIKIINNYIINKFNKDFPNLKMDEQQNLYLAFIRYYAKGLDKEKNKLIKSYGLNISTIYHLDLDDKIHKKIIYNLNVDIKNINKI